MKEKFLYRQSTYIPRATLVITFILVISAFYNNAFSQNGSWVAPTSSDNVNNPYKGIEKATLEGKKLYTQFCAICHGNKGKGDGLAGMALKPRPTNFKKDAVQKQSDGAIYYKMTQGKAPMAAYKETLTDQQRWQLVNYIRTLDK